MACPLNSPSNCSETQSTSSGISARWSGSPLGIEETSELLDQAVVRGNGGVFDQRAQKGRDQVRRHDGVGVQQDHRVVLRLHGSEHPQVHVPGNAEVPGCPVVPEPEIRRHLTASVAPARRGAGVVENQDVEGVTPRFEARQRGQARADEFLAVVDEQRNQDPPGGLRARGHCAPPRSGWPTGRQRTTSSAPARPGSGCTRSAGAPARSAVHDLFAGVDQALGQVDDSGGRHFRVHECLRQ